MRTMRLGDTEISASAIRRGIDNYISAVTVLHHARNGDDMLSLHEWEQPIFESEREALQFAWRRAVAIAWKLTQVRS